MTYWDLVLVGTYGSWKSLETLTNMITMYFSRQLHVLHTSKREYPRRKGWGFRSLSRRQWSSAIRYLRSNVTLCFALLLGWPISPWRGPVFLTLYSSSLQTRKLGHSFLTWYHFALLRVVRAVVLDFMWPSGQLPENRNTTWAAVVAMAETAVPQAAH